MTKPRPYYDRDFWEDLWSKTLREHAEKVKSRPPNAHLTAEAQKLAPGRALDAGCGHGAESLWLAAQGWRVTGVDFSEAALRHARSMADAAGLAPRVDFVRGDLTTWAPEPSAFDLVISLHVHVPGSVEEAVQRLASGVAPSGVLLLVGHQPIDPTTGAETIAAGQTQVSLAAARAALPTNEWTFIVAEERSRSTGGGVDAVIGAKRRGAGE
ncbi:MAG TPA: class I SAM-dependent methyltransferase [Polyangiaceae bacterium]|nr:class I SAM-dependent methyltransferase [Polyangiaceae bacterium]